MYLSFSINYGVFVFWIFLYFPSIDSAVKNPKCIRRKLNIQQYVRYASLCIRLYFVIYVYFSIHTLKQLHGLKCILIPELRSLIMHRIPQLWPLKLETAWIGIGIPGGRAWNPEQVVRMLSVKIRRKKDNLQHTWQLFCYLRCQKNM